MISEPIVSSAERAGNFLAKPEIFYRTVLESLCEGVMLTDAEWRIRYVNRLVTDITGYTPEELLGRTVLEALLPEKHAESPEWRSKDPLADKPNYAELELKRKDGRLHWVHLKTTPYRNELGEIVGTVAALSCIERQKSLEWENELLQDEIRLNFGSIIGVGPAIQKVTSQIATVAPTGANVLVLGEAGTG